MPQEIVGGTHADSRGIIRFCNEFDMGAVKRFYTISNSAEWPVRGWIGHKRETKWFFPLNGTTTIKVEPMSDSTRSTCFELSADSPSVLKIPGGNWFCIEQHDGAEVMVFRTARLVNMKTMI